jgi:hypothetical protein
MRKRLSSILKLRLSHFFLRRKRLLQAKMTHSHISSNRSRGKNSPGPPDWNNSSAISYNILYGGTILLP